MSEYIYRDSIDYFLDQVKNQNIADETGNTKDLKFHDILFQLSCVKEKERKRLEELSPQKINVYVPPGGWKKTTATMSPISISLSSTFSDAAKRKEMRIDYSVARYRITEPKWDKSIKLGKGLSDSIYRTPSGDMIARDETK